MRLILLCLVIFFTSCNSLTVHVPSHRFESPEAGGDHRWHLGFAAGSAHSVTVVSDASSRPPSIGTPTITSSGDLPFRFSYGVLDHLELGIKLGALTSSSLVTAKFQIIGDTSDKSKGGNFSMALQGGFGSASAGNRGDQNGTFGPGGYNWNASANTSITDGSLIIGYRVSTYVLFFGGPFITSYNMSGNIHQDKSDNGLSPAADYQLTGSGQNVGGNLDVLFNFSDKHVFNLIFEAVMSHMTWSNATAAANDVTGGLSLDWYW